ncbi:MAG: BON domain-containing protein [Pseudomonadota bacterium]
MFAKPAYAILPEAPASKEEAAPNDQSTISASQDAGDDPLIAQRIQGIFDELSGFEGIAVEVSEGVVTLSGTLADADAIARAENIAGRVSGVVTVENMIERNLSIEQNLSIIGKMSELLSELVSALPLIAVALLMALVIGAIGYVIAGFRPLWKRLSPNAFLAELVASAIRFVFVIGGLVIALDMLGAGALLGAVLGGAGVVGIALGFAMRDTIENGVTTLSRARSLR